MPWSCYPWYIPGPPAGNNFVAIATGSNDGSLVIKTNSTLAGWGNNCRGELSTPSGSYMAIDVGQGHNVILKTSGYLDAYGGWVWPSPYAYGQTDVDPLNDQVIPSPVIERYSYDVYGKPTIKAPNGSTRSTSAYGNRFMFTGREYDKEAGLYYYRERYYSPTLGRFLQTDPIGYEGGLNLYTYCGNNPIMWIDPWGMDTLGIHGEETHSWISYTDNQGRTDTYGMWHPSKDKWVRSKAGGIGLGGERIRNSDVYKNRESGLSVTSRYYNDLSAEQIARFNKWMEKDHDYTYPTNNCSSWASDTVREVTGEDVDADNALRLGVETPDELLQSIEELEKEDPTRNESKAKKKS